MKIKINKEKCIGCGSCVSIAPETFDFDDDGKAVKSAHTACELKAVDEVDGDHRLIFSKLI